LEGTEVCKRTATQILVTVLNVKVNFVRDLRATGSLYGLGAEEGRECYNDKNERRFGEKHDCEKECSLSCFPK
jgi:hypothetical protein